MRANQRISRDLAAVGLMPDGDHTIPGPTGDSLPVTTSLQHERRKRRLDAIGRSRLYEGGWQIVSIKAGDEEGGITSHRGVLAGDEYVDSALLAVLVERELGFTIEQIHSVYRQGPLSAEQRELRGQIDARLLALSRSGGSMLELARVFGWEMTSSGGGDRCKTMERAIARARAAEFSDKRRAS